jgi:sodium-dependent phosphate cotransporter
MADPATKASTALPAAARSALPRAVASVAGAIALLALLYVFLVAIALFGTAFKLLGSGFSESLIRATSHPVVGLMIGVLSTSLIQSSSGTTSIVVGMVAGGALTVRGAIPIMMGANLGTTITNTMVAMASLNRRTEFQRAFAGATMHDLFNLLAILVLFPLELATRYLERCATWLSDHLVGSSGAEFPNPVKDATMPAVHGLQDLLAGPLGLTERATAIAMFVIGLAALFFALAFLTRLLKQLFLSRAEGALADRLRGGDAVAMLAGLVITVAVQSSSITTSLLVPLIGAGIVPLAPAFAATLGANIGTCVTALLASLAGTPAALTVALVHLLFNLTGIVLLYPIPAVRRIPIRLATALARRTARRRMFAVYYMVGVFFVMPMLFVLVDKLLFSH